MKRKFLQILSVLLIMSLLLMGALKISERERQAKYKVRYQACRMVCL